MTNQELTYWLDGYLRLNPNPLLRKKEIGIIKNHLQLVYTMEGYFSNQNKKLNALLCSSQAENAEFITNKVKQINSINPTF